MLNAKIVELRKTLISQAVIVETMLDKCISGLLERKRNLLEEIIKTDETTVNQFELKIDELCLEILALYHPEASDLRLTTMLSKMTSDLERIGDCAVNIAESSILIIEKNTFYNWSNLKNMANEAILMVKDSISSFLEENSTLAYQVCQRDDVVDLLRDKIWQELIELMRENPDFITDGITIMRIANNFEKIADISTNIAEETVFIVNGRTIKHHEEEKHKHPTNSE